MFLKNLCRQISVFYIILYIVYNPIHLIFKTFSNFLEFSKRFAIFSDSTLSRTTQSQSECLIISKDYFLHMRTLYIVDSNVYENLRVQKALPVSWTALSKKISFSTVFDLSLGKNFLTKILLMKTVIF